MKQKPAIVGMNEILTGFVVLIIFIGPGHPFGSMTVLCISSTISVIATLSTDRIAYALAIPMNPMTAIIILFERAPIKIYKEYKTIACIKSIIIIIIFIL